MGKKFSKGVVNALDKIAEGHLVGKLPEEKPIVANGHKALVTAVAQGKKKVEVYA